MKFIYRNFTPIFTLSNIPSRQGKYVKIAKCRVRSGWWEMLILVTLCGKSLTVVCAFASTRIFFFFFYFCCENKRECVQLSACLDWCSPPRTHIQTHWTKEIVCLGVFTFSLFQCDLPLQLSFESKQKRVAFAFNFSCWSIKDRY